MVVRYTWKVRIGPQVSLPGRLRGKWTRPAGTDRTAVLTEYQEELF